MVVVRRSVWVRRASLTSCSTGGGGDSGLIMECGRRDWRVCDSAVPSGPSGGRGRLGNTRGGVIMSPSACHPRRAIAIVAV